VSRFLEHAPGEHDIRVESAPWSSASVRSSSSVASTPRWWVSMCALAFRRSQEASAASSQDRHQPVVPRLIVCCPGQGPARFVAANRYRRGRLTGSIVISSRVLSPQKLVLGSMMKYRVSPLSTERLSRLSPPAPARNSW
jgi:hypothetical protein